MGEHFTYLYVTFSSKYNMGVDRKHIFKSNAKVKMCTTILNACFQRLGFSSSFL
jgi:predicted HAD superfamily Cof-like phosphohydrolase